MAQCSNQARYTSSKEQRHVEGPSQAQPMQMQADLQSKALVSMLYVPELQSDAFERTHERVSRLVEGNVCIKRSIGKVFEVNSLMRICTMKLEVEIRLWKCWPTLVV